MYKLTVKGDEFTIPKENLRFLAMSKAMDLKLNVQLKTDEQAIEFLGRMGIEVSDAEN